MGSRGPAGPPGKNGDDVSVKFVICQTSYNYNVDFAVDILLINETETAWLHFNYLLPERHLVYVSEIMFLHSDILSVCLQQGEAGKAGRPGERGAAGPQVSDNQN